MFVFSINKKKLIKYGICLCVTIAVGITAISCMSNTKVPDSASCEQIGEYSLVAGDDTHRKSFLQQFGYKAMGDAVETNEVIIPQSFNTIYENYNKLQIVQGLDLSAYKGKQVEQITYMVEPVTSATDKFSTEDEADSVKYAVLLIYKDKVIGGHIESGLQNDKLKGFCQ